MDNALNYLLKKLNEERSNVINTMVQGTLDHGAYKNLCGAIQGLDFAAELVKDLATKLEQQEDE